MDFFLNNSLLASEDIKNDLMIFIKALQVIGPWCVL